MINWTITEHSNPMDKELGFRRVLTEMRNYVRTTAAGTETIQINMTAGHLPPRTTLRMSANNFQITHINGHAIHYNYTVIPTFYAFDLSGTIPTGMTAVDASQKTKLLYLLPEAARSVVIEQAMAAAIRSSGSVPLQTYAPLVNNYGHTCEHVGLDVASLARPLTDADYLGYANTLAAGTPDRDAITALCGG